MIKTDNFWRFSLLVFLSDKRWRGINKTYSFNYKLSIRIVNDVVKSWSGILMGCLNEDGSKSDNSVILQGVHKKTHGCIFVLRKL